VYQMNSNSSASGSSIATAVAVGPAQQYAFQLCVRQRLSLAVSLLLASRAFVNGAAA
jgi:hypothetical protein